jgi:calcineurin-like phosphoesterase family protein
MANLFFVSDTHFSHPLMVRLRGFRSVQEMDELMIERWNETVRPQDHVYHLGDVTMRREFLDVVKRLNGHKRLIFGNHDIFDYGCYVKAGFKKLMAYRVVDRIIFSHVPVHPAQLSRFRLNVHGHLHTNRVMEPGSLTKPDRRYTNVCVEQTGYVPVSLEDLRKNCP